MKKGLILLVMILTTGVLYAGPKKNLTTKICPKKVNNKIEVAIKSGKVRIFDLNGKLRIKTKLRNIDLTSLPNGWYLVKTRAGSQVIQKTT